MDAGSGRKRDTQARSHHPYRVQILGEQVTQLYDLAPVGFVATFVNAVIIFLVMRDVRYDLLVPWLTAVLLITGMRAALVFWFRRARRDPAAAPVWGRRFVVSLAVIGIAWGSIGLFPFSGLSLAHQVFIAFVLGGMAAGASSTFSTLHDAYPAFTLPALAPLALHFFLLNDTFHVAMGTMLSLFGFLLWRISRYNYGVNLRSLLLRFRNRRLIDRLKRTKEEVEGLNVQLRAEIVAKRKQEELQGEKEAADAANRAKSEFLANMSHEMRTPLAGTLGMIKLVLDMEIGDEEKRLLVMAERSAESLLRIIADLLDFSRIEAGMMSFEKKVFSLHKTVQSVVEIVSLGAVEKNLPVLWTIGDGVSERVKGDEGRLRQVLINLIGNAVKFTEEGRVEVTVRQVDDPLASGRPCILFSVRDTGVGIPPEQQEKIFYKFTQGDSSIAKKYGGTGLGLALSREIVEKMGGRIWVESDVGIGSTFSFTFLPD